ncbi:MAG: tetratricopeptide repeat protein [Deltaproteobacteria bacterium]|nr:tetratricopeptide repeat protein [Deltaproteobacteria bacterium]
MSTKCTVCNRSKGKRECGIYDGRLICSRCCGENRSAQCEGCRYYQNSIKYQEGKEKSLDRKKFVIELNDEIDQTIDRAMAAVEKGEFSKAEKILDKLTQEHPKHHMVLYGMGVFLAMQGQYDKAIEYLKDAVQVFPLFMEAYYNLAIAYKSIFDIANMLRALRKVMELAEPGCVQYATAQDMIKVMEESFRRDGVGLDAFISGQDEFDRALSLMEKGDYKSAIKGFERSIRWHPNLPQPYGNMGICYAKLGNRQAALSAFEKALEINPAYEPAILNKQATEKLVEGRYSARQPGARQKMLW